MSTKLPRRPRSLEHDSQAKSELRRLVEPQMRFIDEPAPEFGVDVTLEVVLGAGPEGPFDTPSNYRSVAQVKGTDAVKRKRSGTMSMRLRVSTMNYLLNQPLALLFLFAPKLRQMRWGWALDAKGQLDKDRPNWRNQTWVSVPLNKLWDDGTLSEICSRIELHGRDIRDRTRLTWRQLGSFIDPTQGGGIDDHTDPEAVGLRKVARELVLEFLDAGDPGSALNRLDSDLATLGDHQPDRAYLLNLKALVLRWQGNERQAEATFREAYSLDAKPRYLASSALCLLDLGQDTEGLRILESLLEATGLAYAGILLSRYYRTKGDVGLARSALDRIRGNVLAINKPDLAFCRADLYFTEGRFDEGKAILTQLMTEERFRISAQVDLAGYTLLEGIRLRRADLIEESLSLARPLVDSIDPSRILRAADVDRARADCAELVCHALYALGRIDEASSLAESLSERWPTDEVLAVAASMALLKGDRAEFRRRSSLIQKPHRVSDEQFQYFRCLDASSSGASNEVIEGLVQTIPHTPLGSCLRAMVSSILLERSGKVDEAIAQLKQVLLDPDVNVGNRRNAALPAAGMTWRSYGEAAYLDFIESLDKLLLSDRLVLYYAFAARSEARGSTASIDTVERIERRISFLRSELPDAWELDPKSALVACRLFCQLYRYLSIKGAGDSASQSKCELLLLDDLREIERSDTPVGIAARQVREDVEANKTAIWEPMGLLLPEPGVVEF